MFTKATLIVEGGPHDGSHELDASYPEGVIPPSVNTAWSIYSLLKDKRPGAAVVTSTDFAIQQRQEHGNLLRVAHKYEVVSRSSLTPSHDVLTVKYLGPVGPKPT